MKKRFGLLLTLTMLFSLSASTFAQTGPQIRVSPDSLSYTLPRYLWTSQTFYVHNDGDAPLNISITDAPLASAANRPGKPANLPPAEAWLGKLKQRLRQLPLSAPAAITERPPFQHLPAEAIAISDSVGDVPNPGLDVVSVDMAETFFNTFYTFSVEFAATPDSGALAILSIDLDQNFASGAFPSPLGFGPGVFDVGSEYDIVFDIGNFLGDSLGIPPSAIVLDGGDTSFAIVGLPVPLTFSGNTVEANLPKVFFPTLIDDNLNAAMVCLTISGLDLPDFAPNYGHGLLGQENGLSWLAQSDTSGAAATPLQATIAPGDSFPVEATVVTVNPDGSYPAEIRIANNSSNAPELILPVTLTIGGIASPALTLDPAFIADTLTAGQSPVTYPLTITNSGNGSLVYLVSDSTLTGSGWLNVGGIPLGNLGGGESAVVDVEVDPAGLAAGQSYSGMVLIASNAVNGAQQVVPVTIFIQASSGIEDGDAIPRRLALHGNYPNPFNPATEIAFDLPASGRVDLAVYNILGQQVRTLVDAPLAPGEYRVEWDGRNEAGMEASSGVYLYRLHFNRQVLTRKMTLIR